MSRLSRSQHLAVVSIDHSEYLVSSDAALKIVALLRDAVRVREDFGARRARADLRRSYSVDEIPVDVTLVSVHEDQIARHAGAAPASAPRKG